MQVMKNKINILLDEILYVDLKKICIDTDTTASQLVRRLLRKYIHECEKKKELDGMLF